MISEMQNKAPQYPVQIKVYAALQLVAFAVSLLVFPAVAWMLAVINAVIVVWYRLRPRTQESVVGARSASQ